MTTQEHTNVENKAFVEVDKMRYQENKTSARLVLISLIFSLIALFVMITYDNFNTTGNSLRVVPDARIGVAIGIGIVLMLVTFMASEKIKFYDSFWSRFGLFILAGINFLRIFNIPFYIYGLYDDEMTAMIPRRTFIYIITLFILSGLALLVAGIVATKKVSLLQKHLKEK